MTNASTVDASVTELAEGYKQWVLGAEKRRPLMPQNKFKEGSDRNYNLKNLEERKYLQWEDQRFGVNLGWTDNTSPATATRVARWFFARRDGGNGQIKYGEPIAIGYGRNPSFLRYHHRHVGINLEFVNTPVFEWRLLGGVAGRPVECGDRIAVHNARAGSSAVPGVLIRFDRTLGGDIGWPDSETWSEQATDKLVGLAKDRVTKLVMAKLGLA